MAHCGKMAGSFSIGISPYKIRLFLVLMQDNWFEKKISKKGI
jgi:hypothetical protein